MFNKTLFIVSFLAYLIICPSCNCKKQIDKPVNPADKLPPATQTGANTFGCLVNGEVVVIHKPLGDLSPAFGCEYQLIYNSPTGFSFNIYGSDKKDGCHQKTVSIHLDGLQLEETTYLLNKPIKYGRSGAVSIISDCPPAPVLFNYTDSTTKGAITITHFDQKEQIVSGTFWFYAVETTSGDTVHVTDGRFDMQYTQ